MSDGLLRRSLGRGCWLLVLAAPLAAALPPAADTGLDACPVALELTFTGLGDVPAAAQRVAVCLGDGDANVTREFAIEAPITPNRDVPAALQLARNGDGYDLDLTAGTQRFSARGIPATSDAATALTADGKPAGASPQVRVRRLDAPYVGVDITDANLRQLAADVAALKHIDVAQIERIDAAGKGSFYLSAVSVEQLLQLVADNAGLELRPRGTNGFAFGRSRNAAAIETERRRLPALRDSADKTALRAALLRIVALGSDTKAEGWPPVLFDELHELALLAEDDAQWAGAEKFRKRQLQQFDDRPELPLSWRAIVLARLSDLRRRQDDNAGAADFLQRARAALAQVDATDATGRSGVLAALGTSALAAGDAAAAATDSERACALVMTAATPDFDELWRVAKLAYEIGIHYADAGQFAAAHAHLERNFALQQRLFGAQAPEADVYRTTLMFNALHRNDRALAATYQHAQIALSERRGDVDSTDYAMALIYLTPYLVQQRRIDDATRHWQRVVDLRVRHFGPDHETVVQGLRDLALLQRLTGNDAQASATHQRAKAMTPQPASADGDAAMREALAWDLGAQLAVMYDATLAHRDPTRAPDVELAQLYERRGIVALDRGEDAAVALRTALDLRERLQGKDHADTQRTRALLASAVTE